MMTNMIEQVLGNKLAPLLGQLENLGLNSEQARQLLGEASEQTVAGLHEAAAKTDLSTQPEQHLLSALIGKIDIKALADTAGISSDLAGKALQTIMPSLIKAFSSTSALGSLEGMLKQGQGGMADKLKSGLGKFLS